MQSYLKKPLIILTIIGALALVGIRHRAAWGPSHNHEEEAKLLITPKAPIPAPEIVATDARQSYESDVPASSGSPVLPKVPDPDDWGDPILEGDLLIEDSRLAHQKVYRTQLKYSLIMVQHLWQVSDFDPQQKEYLGERKMVADHLVVRLHKSEDRTRFEQLIARDGMTVRKQMYAPGMFLVSFPIEEIDSFQKAQAKLSAMPEVRSATPDIFGRGF